jgi:hypothetical protein
MTKSKASIFDVTQRGDSQFLLQLKEQGQWVGEEGLFSMSHTT